MSNRYAEKKKQNRGYLHRMITRAPVSHAKGVMIANTWDSLKNDVSLTTGTVLGRGAEEDEVRSFFSDVTNWMTCRRRRNCDSQLKIA